MEKMKCITHPQVSKLLHNKFVVVLGDSIQRAVYKDMVVLLQRDNYLSLSQLKSKGETCFEKDSLVEGGRMGHMTNGTEYREVRQFRTDHHLVRYYFLTRIYSRYVESILEDFRNGIKPDVVVVNSCIWDVSRYGAEWADEYKENLNTFFKELNRILPKDSLVMWNLTMPLGKRPRVGGFLVPEIAYKAPTLRYDVVEANFYGGTLADAHGLDVLDMHHRFRFSLQHRMKDGVHWNGLVHRQISTLLLRHAARAWGVTLPCAAAAVGQNGSMNHETFADDAVTCGSAGGKPGYSYPPPPDYFSSKAEYHHFDKQFYEDSLPTSRECGAVFLSFEDNREEPKATQFCRGQPEHTAEHRVVPAYRRPLVDQSSFRNSFEEGNMDLGFANRHHPSVRPFPPPHPTGWVDNQYVMRNRHIKQPSSPYTRKRPSHHQHRSYRY